MPWILHVFAKENIFGLFAIGFWQAAADFKMHKQIKQVSQWAPRNESNNAEMFLKWASESLNCQFNNLKFWKWNSKIEIEKSQ